MRALKNKTRVQAPDGDYPNGRIKDRTAQQRGTPVDEELYGDMHQFFERLMSLSDIEANDLPDSAYSGFQLSQAFLKTSNKYNATPLIEALLGRKYVTNELIILFGVKYSLSNSNNTLNWTEGSVFYNGSVYLVTASSGGGITKGFSETFTFYIENDDDFLISLIDASPGSGIGDYDNNSVQRLNSSGKTGFTIAGVANGSIVIDAATVAYKFFNKNGSMNLNFNYRATITATGGGAKWLNFKITTPSWMKASADMIAGFLTLMYTVDGNIYKFPAVSYDLSVDNNGDILLTLDNTFSVTSSETNIELSGTINYSR